MCEASSKSSVCPVRDKKNTVEWPPSISSLQRWLAWVATEFGLWLKENSPDKPTDMITYLRIWLTWYLFVKVAARKRFHDLADIKVEGCRENHDEETLGSIDSVTAVLKQQVSLEFI